MITNLKLTNFRKIVADEMTFTSGINVLRGANEISKTSRLEAIAYALFGTKALRTSLEDAVTHGQDPKTLKVELTIKFGDEVFEFSRSKGGAEVRTNGKPFVTGQNEVSAFASKMFGTDLNVASKLLLANQNSIRGALEGGPKELSVLIEDLASMDIFDTILDQAQQKLALGSPALLEERLKGAEATLAAATESLPPQPDEATHQTKVSALNQQVVTLEASLATLEANAATATTQWQEASRLYLKRTTLEAELAKASDRFNDAKKQVETLKPAAAQTVDTDRVINLKTQIVEAEDYDKRVIAYRIFKNLPEGERYEGSSEAFELALDEATNTVSLDNKHLAGIEREVAVLKAKRINRDTCDKCGQDITHLEHVKETNAGIDAELAKLATQAETLTTELERFTAIERNLLALRKFAREVDTSLIKLGSNVSVDANFYPPKVTWVGGIPGDGPDAAGLQRELDGLEAQAKAVASAQAKLELAEEQMVKAQGECVKAQEALSNFDGPDADEVVALAEVKDNATLDFNAARGHIILAQREIEDLTRDYDAAAKLWNMAQGRITDARQVIESCKADLDSLAFNNGLVRRIRAIRPVVATRIWNAVLSSVSVMFSQMRNEDSVITKDAGGFKCNAQSVESLSGSTLDLLGLSIRCALLRTFLPNCGLLVLDEPCAAMDQGRTESMLGFLKAVDFSQTLLVTHEPTSTSIADNLIEL